MKNSNIGIIAAIFLLLTALVWYFYSGQSQNSMQSSSETIYNDSIDAREQPTITQQKDTVRNAIGEDLAPGTALVRATVLGIEQKDEKPASITVMIDEVMGYGSSTSPISSNAELNVDVRNVVADDADAVKQFREGVKTLLVIEGSKGIQSGESADGKTWRVLEFKIQ